MEEDILQRVIQEIKTYGDLDGIEDIRPLGKAIENLIARNKELENKVNVLEQEKEYLNTIIDSDNDNYIPKSKVRELREIDNIDYLQFKIKELLQEGDDK